MFENLHLILEFFDYLVTIFLVPCSLAVQMNGCGGTLIAPDTVLTAAHCNNMTGDQVIIGAYKMNSLGEGAQERFCEKWIQDPNHVDDYYLNLDFALCKLDRPVNIDQSSIVLELNEFYSVPSAGENVIAIGMGSLGPKYSYEDKFPSILQKVALPSVSNEICEDFDSNFNENFLCAVNFDGDDDSLFPDTSKTPWYGDSGGPLVTRKILNDGSMIDTLVGVTSYASAYFEIPTFSRVSSRLDWIKDATCNVFESVASFCPDKTLAPTESPSACEINLSIRLKTDAWARETSWKLLDSNYNVVQERQYVINNFENIHNLCLTSDECYTWELRDEGYDGILCTEQDSYEISLNGDPIRSGGISSYYVNESFCATDTQPPTLSPTDTFPPTTESPTTTLTPTTCVGNIEYQILLFSDSFGYETSISTYLLSEDFTELEELVVEKIGSFDSNSLHVLPAQDDHYCLEDDRCYIFFIGDSYGDGLISGAYYAGYVNQRLVFSGYGGYSDFNSCDQRIFCTGNASPSPSPFPSFYYPTMDPSTYLPTITLMPTYQDDDMFNYPTRNPTRNPTRKPTITPTTSPTRNPTTIARRSLQTLPNTCRNSAKPFFYSTNASSTEELSQEPTRSPTRNPTRTPTRKPTSKPSRNPTRPPTRQPTRLPTRLPTNTPSNGFQAPVSSSDFTCPTSFPSGDISPVPTNNPTQKPTREPSNRPTRDPTRDPTKNLIRTSTRTPTIQPTRFSKPTNDSPTDTKSPAKVKTSCRNISKMLLRERRKMCNIPRIKKECPGICDKKLCSCVNNPFRFRVGDRTLTCKALKRSKRKNQLCERFASLQNCPQVCGSKNCAQSSSPASSSASSSASNSESSVESTSTSKSSKSKSSKSRKELLANSAKSSKSGKA